MKWKNWPPSLSNLISPPALWRSDCCQHETHGVTTRLSAPRWQLWCCSPPCEECAAPVDYFLSEGTRLLKENFGIKNTYYASPHGLSNVQNKTTCYDMAIITINTLKIKINRDVCQQLDYECFARKEGIPTDHHPDSETYQKRRYHWKLGQTMGKK